MYEGMQLTFRVGNDNLDLGWTKMDVVFYDLWFLIKDKQTKPVSAMFGN
jgi:hypothetical protein